MYKQQQHFRVLTEEEFSCKGRSQAARGAHPLEQQTHTKNKMDKVRRSD